LVVLDSWALLAFLKDEPAAERVLHAWQSDDVAMSSISLGEALYVQIRENGDLGRRAVMRAATRLEVIAPDWPLVVEAAEIKARGGLAYADAFCVATARRLEAALWTGDPEIAALSEEVEVVDLRAA
jgi:uncharacterized protein